MFASRYGATDHGAFSIPLSTGTGSLSTADKARTSNDSGKFAGASTEVTQAVSAGEDAPALQSR